jgi:hypothetical protein
MIVGEQKQCEHKSFMQKKWILSKEEFEPP